MFGASAKEPPRSKEFDDVYFNANDGFAETQHVFIEGNTLPGRLAMGQGGVFTIAETGFGTGLNFLAAWKCFDEHAGAGQKLHFISFEKYPLDHEEIELHLQPWAEIFGDYLPRLTKAYPILSPGFHRVDLADNVMLTLIFDDVNDAMAGVDARVDAWFLDGFKPSTNPGMWTDTVFENMARMSADGTTFATFTAAGAVRRGLAAQGFAVKKVAGYGTKRDMSVGLYEDTDAEGAS